jgi:oxalate oxidoreductase subunit alpha
MVQGFTSGLGGEVITHDDFFRMAEMMRRTLEEGRILQHSTWVNFNDYV